MTAKEEMMEKYRMKLWVKVAAATARHDNVGYSEPSDRANRVLAAFDKAFKHKS